MEEETVIQGELPAEALEELREARRLLENPRFIARLTDMVGQPIEAAIDFLPESVSSRVHDIVRDALTKVLDLSIRTMDGKHMGGSADFRHKLASGISGALGGAFGAPALAIELPISTGIILRSIADIARSEGEDLRSLDSRMACIEVFALGGRSTEDDGAETGYYAVRAALAKAISDAAKHFAEKGVVDHGAPVLARLIAQVASRFTTVVSEKVAAQAVPVIGALGGATVNVLFVEHFQNMARGHFVIRRLERVYGKDVVEDAYYNLTI